METRISGRNVEITDRFREVVDAKAEKVAHLAERATRLDVTVSRHHEKSQGSAGDDRVELTLVGPGPVVRAEAGAGDKYGALDLAFGKLLERVRRAKDRRKVHRGQHRPDSLRSLPAELAPSPDRAAVGPGPEAAAEDDYCPVVIRTKSFSSEPMTVDDALYYMELVGHDFYLFRDADGGVPSVVYRRKGWDYGVIRLDDSAEERQEDATTSLARASR